MPRSWPIGCRIGTETIKGAEKRVEPRRRYHGEEGVEAGMMGRRLKLPFYLDHQGLEKTTTATLVCEVWSDTQK